MGINLAETDDTSITLGSHSVMVVTSIVKY